MKTWRKFGLIGLIIAGILSFIQTVLFLTCNTDWFCGLTFALPFGIFLDPILKQFPQSLSIILIIIFQLLIIWIIFSIIGWLYGKIKNRKLLKANEA